MTEDYTQGYAGNAVIYARVSTDDHDQDPMTQVRNIRKWCNDRHIEIAGEYVEERSAKDTNRPALRECLGQIMLDDITMLVAWAPSRLSRDVDDMGQIVSICKQRKTMICYVSSEEIRPESGPGKLLNLVSTWQGEEERAKLRQNTKEGIQSAKLKGKHCGRMLALCWADEVAENQKRIQPEGEHRTHIVSKSDVLGYASQGMTYTRVAKKIIGVAPDTLKSAMIRAGMFDDYQRLYSEAVGKPQQGDAPTTGAFDGQNVPTRGEVA